MFKSRKSNQVQQSQEDQLELEDGIQNSIKRLKLKNEGLGARKLPESKIVGS